MVEYHSFDELDEETRIKIKKVEKDINIMEESIIDFPIIFSGRLIFLQAFFVVFGIIALASYLIRHIFF